MYDLRNDCFVYIIESPSDEDLLDGRTEGKTLQELMRLADIPNTYNLVTSRKTFDAALGPRLPAAMTRHAPGWIPIVHFSCHGSDDGLALTDCTVIRWRELRTRLLPLNDSLHDAGIPFLLCISACFSAAANRIARTESGTPGFWALVGHPDSPYWSDAAVGFAAFYHLLFRGSHPRDAVEGMRAASGDPRFEIAFGDDEQRAWLQQMRSGETLLTALEDRLKYR